MITQKQFWILTTFTAAIASMSACGSKKNENPFSPRDTVVVSDGSDRKALEEAKVTCEGTDCPEGVALMVSQTGKGVFDLCTAFLVDEDIVATNSHCLPALLETLGSSTPSTGSHHRPLGSAKKKTAKPVVAKAPPKDRQEVASASRCANIRFFFPRTGSQLQQTVECQSIIGASKIVSTATGREIFNFPDYAFIRLKRKVGRTALPLSREGLADKMEVTTWAMFRDTGATISAVLRGQTCEVTQGTTIVPSFNRPTSSIVTLAKCETEKGNSGAPIIDQQGNVRAIGFAIFNSKASEIDGLKGPGTPFKPLLIATNVACIQAPRALSTDLLVRARGEDCDHVANQEELLNALKVGDGTVESPTFTRPEMFKFSSKETPLSGTTGYVTPQIECMKNPSIWVDGITDPKAAGLEEFSKHGTKVSLSISAPLWKMTFGLDENFKVQRLDIGEGKVLSKVEFDTANLADASTEYRVTSETLGKDGESADSVFSVKPLSVCKD